MDRLLAFVNLQQVEPFLWGQSDCVLMAADWVRAVRGVDPAADLRLTYGSAAEAERVLRWYSDPLAVVAPRMAAAGLALTDAPVRGDVAVIDVPDERGRMRPHGAVLFGQRFWAVRAEVGVTCIARDVVAMRAAWGVGYVV
ncbi:DUF6950 family protein [Paragemmobacter ruber]|uniref:DUF6950 domain-containing protein n=1 Tax=Paragemmobacter ruber TaxID=1985673 RepID=A0ABW9Y110_9RHOB|nr:hypothetical protein [Rhodobacter ruber]NBE05924.1 hypothetical protein [Rhodobacter ruber]